jgi:hypothetical protein
MTSEIQMMEEEYERFSSDIEGMEDVRIFQHQGALRFMASSKKITNDGKIVISYGEYHLDTAKMCNMTCFMVLALNTARRTGSMSA